MARAYRGPYARPSAYPIPYATASVWGTGINDVHAYYGEGPPLRVIGRAGHMGSSPVANQGPRDRGYQQPADSSNPNPDQIHLWGYPGGVNYGPDSFGAGADAPLSEEDVGWDDTFHMDDRPGWGDTGAGQRLRASTGDQTRWGQWGGVFRAVRDGAHRYRSWSTQPLKGQAQAYQPVTQEAADSYPSETVSEGWLNKTRAGAASYPANSQPSDDAQIFVQTSDRQRYRTKVNDRAVARDTDDARHFIDSRVEPMIAKTFSTGERSYDMAPYQIDQIERPFRFRTAGVGPAEWMTANEINSLSPIQRTPPADPSMGVTEVEPYEDYGYTQEDSMYYA
jgi:hypothetical protein